MQDVVRAFQLVLLPTFIGLLSCARLAKESAPRGQPAGSTLTIVPRADWSRHQQAVHVLNRLAYGPSPRDVEAVEQMGVASWIDWQMHPQQIPDEAVELQLRAFPTLGLSSHDLLAAYPPPAAGAAIASQATPPSKDSAPPMELPREIIVELTGAKLVRSVESQRQLEEVLVDFWFNHFNVSADKGEVKWLVTSFERDAIRPHVFGTFREMLGAVARHPAMLFYLDNWLSARDRFDARDFPKGRLAPKRRPPRAAGLNENYARELLELHTLGVDGGYTQQDVREVARCFTGWSIDQPKKQGTFIFRDFAHDKQPKVVLGTKVPGGGGIEDGERVLDLVASHPSTAHFIATKLARRFVSDHPSASLVERVASTFQETRGNLRSVYLALFSSTEFWSNQAFASKTKTPLEYVVSAIRVLGGTTNGDIALGHQLERMGQPLYRCQPPTGFAETADTWINPGALITRINFGLALAANRIRGTSVDATRYVRRSAGPPTLDGVLDPLAALILDGRLATSTRQTLFKALAQPEAERVEDGEHRAANPVLVAGLLLGSPEFQKQ